MEIHIEHSSNSLRINGKEIFDRGEKINSTKGSIWEVVSELHNFNFCSDCCSEAISQIDQGIDSLAAFSLHALAQKS